MALAAPVTVLRILAYCPSWPESSHRGAVIRDGYHGRYGDLPIVSDLPLPLLTGDPPRQEGAQTGNPGPSAHAMAVRAQLLDRDVTVTVAHDEAGSWLGFPDGTRLWVDAPGERIEVHSCGGDWRAILIGPGLLLALARRGRWCWHASAFAMTDGWRWLALAPSGTGKSSLARAVAAAGGRRIVDDLALVDRDPLTGGLRLWPRFPQQKWAGSEHWPASEPTSIPVDGLALLQRGDRARRTRLHSAQALGRALLSHTVASRLFDPATLTAHLAFVAAAALSLQTAGTAQVWSAPTLEDPAAAWRSVWESVPD